MKNKDDSQFVWHHTTNYQPVNQLDNPQTQWIDKLWFFFHMQ